MREKMMIKPSALKVVTTAVSLTYQINYENLNMKYGNYCLNFYS